jgi:hypothetical protein
LITKIEVCAGLQVDKDEAGSAQLRAHVRMQPILDLGDSRGRTALMKVSRLPGVTWRYVLICA